MKMTETGNGQVFLGTVLTDSALKSSGNSEDGEGRRLSTSREMRDSLRCIKRHVFQGPSQRSGFHELNSETENNMVW